MYLYRCSVMHFLKHNYESLYTPHWQGLSIESPITLSGRNEKSIKGDNNKYLIRHIKILFILKVLS